MKKNLIPTTAIAAILSITSAAYADITVTQRITMDGIPEMAGGGPAPAPAPKPAPKPAPMPKPKKLAEGGRTDTTQDKAMIKKAFKQHQRPRLRASVGIVSTQGRQEEGVRSDPQGGN